MSKRWRVRKRNAAKIEKSRRIIGDFYDSVLSELEKLKKQPPEKTKP